MVHEGALLESQTLRASVAERTEALDKVKALSLLPDGVHVTTRMVARYFEVSEHAVGKLVQRHREELTGNGFRTLRGSDLEFFKKDILSSFPESYPQPRSNLALFTRRAVLNVAMLLRDSDVARRVRAYLLDVEGRRRTGPGVVASPAEPAPGDASLERRVTNLECAVSDVGSVLRELGPVIARISSRLERVDHRLLQMERRQVNTERVVSAMSRRLADMGEDMRAMRADVNRLARDCARRHRRDR